MSDSNGTGGCRRQGGVVLVLVLVVLLITTLLGLSAVNSTLLDTQVSGNASEAHTAFQAAETLLAVTREEPPSTYSKAITIAPTTVNISVPTEVSGKFLDTTVGASLNYEGEGTVAFGSTIGKFKPQLFRSRGAATRDVSGASATHAQGIVVLSPGN
jgi:type IV pilus assembly protein PilX